MELQEKDGLLLELAPPLLMVKAKNSFSKSDRGYHTVMVINTPGEGLTKYTVGDELAVEATFLNEYILDGHMHEGIYLLNETMVKGRLC